MRKEQEKKLFQGRSFLKGVRVIELLKASFYRELFAFL